MITGVGSSFSLIFPNAAERSTARNDTASGNAVSMVAVAKEVNEMGA